MRKRKEKGRGEKERETEKGGRRERMECNHI